MNFRAFQTMQRVTELGDRFISYVDQGSGKPLILLHDMATWGYLWAGILPDLAEFRVLVPDLPGFGYSDKSDRFDRSLARQTEMIGEWMTRIGVKRAAIAGHGIGGGVALRLATLFPRLVARLCLMSPVCYDSWPQEALWDFGRAGADRRYSASGTIMLVKEQLREELACCPGEEMLNSLLAPYSTGVGKRSLMRDISAQHANDTTEITPLLPRIGVPTLILWGKDDQLQRSVYGERLAADIPGARLIRMENARHYLMLDAKAKVAEHLREFLKEA